MSNGGDIRGAFQLFAIIVVIIFAAAIAAVASLIFIIYHWVKIYKVEGRRPIFWLFAITGIVGIPLVVIASNKFEYAMWLLEREADLFDILGAILVSVMWMFATTAPTVAYLVYRYFVPVSPIRLGAIRSVDSAYQRGEITRKERNRRVGGLQRMKEDELEEMIVSGGEPKTPPVSPSPAPTFNQAPSAPPRSHPRNAFDIPDRGT